MRIAWLISHMWPDVVGGEPVGVEFLSKYMQSWGHNVQLWVGARPRGPASVLSDGREVIGLGHARVSERLWRLAPAVRFMNALRSLRMRPRADVVFTPNGLFASACILRGHSIPLVYCPAGTTVGSFKDEYEVIKSMRWYDRIGGKVLLPANHYAIPERLSLCRSSGIIAVSEVVKRQMLRISEGCAYRIRVIHNGYEPKIIDTRHGGRTSQRAPRVGPGIEVICVGRLSPVKNLGHLIRAWALVKASPKRLRIVGSGGQMQKLKALADELGLSENVDFMGQRMDVPQLLHEADVFVLPSLSESFGTAVVEAMGAGLPCITVRNVEGISEVGASGEANLNEVTGFCVDPLDPEDLARRIDYLADHPDKRIEMGKAAQERAYSRFTWEHAARQYLRFACDLTGGK